MKFEPGDTIVVQLTNEEGKVLEIINEKMVMIEVKGVRFPAYTDQLDFPYFKMFTEKRKADKKKIFIDNIKPEKQFPKTQTVNGVFLTFIPVFDKDIFDDDVVEKFKIHLINETKLAYKFTYNLYTGGESIFELKNSIAPLHDFYLHDVPFEYLSDNPRFHLEFELAVPEKNKAPFFETALKLKGKQLFKKIEETQLKNEPSFSYLLFDAYPDKVEEEKIDLGRLGNAGYRVYDARKIRENLPPYRSVVDLHIDKLTDSWKHMGNFEILSMQLKEFEKFYELAIAHYQPSLTIIHGVGTGKLRDEIHDILRTRKEVKSFVNQYEPAYGYGATQIYFTY
ncbi:MAG TPA: Smr/MutS family protein [Ferruginibacter sp.]|nr:Smr/MutS family protein [Ferruginibacter sp.]HMP21578.1 Smr/MutS family protein [Ferruginibacter sp.]